MTDSLCIEQHGEVTVYQFLDSEDGTVDAWSAAMIAQIDSTPVDVPFRVLMDVSASNVSFTRHARQTSVMLFTRYGHRRGRLAFLFSSRTAPHFGRIFFASLGRLTFQREFFSSRARAMAWLREPTP